MKVLFVEDDEVVRQSTYKGLEQFHDVDLAIDGTRGIELFEANDYDAVITDIHMPNGDGTSLIDVMVKRDRHIPIIVVTGYSDIAEKYREFGCVEVLNKPLDMRDILFLLERSKNKTFGNCSKCKVGDSIVKANDAVRDILKHLGLDNE